MSSTGDDKSNNETKQETKATVVKTDNCRCKTGEHYSESITSSSKAHNDDDHDHTLEEWERHTTAYRDAWGEQFVEFSPLESSEGEARMLEWAKANHPKLCCANRHKDQQLAVEAGT